MKGLLIEGNDKEEVEEDKNDNENQKDEGEADETASDVVDIRSDDTKGQCRVMRKKWQWSIRKMFLIKT